jgi:SAM-dependent methyltransferase
MPPLQMAAHERRIALLDALTIGDISQSTIVDFGVGSWGFACIYPRLQSCAYAIGIDISQAAIDESQRISSTREFPYGDRFRYLTSQGHELKLESNSVDLLFAGEAIEHIDNPLAFVDEVHRVLKPGGQFIVTTPNAGAYLYRQTGEICAVGPEHVSLMTAAELRELLEPAFDVVGAHGFNFTLHHTIDHLLQDADFAKGIGGLFGDAPDLGSGLVFHMRRRDDYRQRGYEHTYVHHDSPHVTYHGTREWQTLPLHGLLTGRMSSTAQRAWLEFEVEGEGLILQLWTHDWSGEAVIEVDGKLATRVGLYSPQAGFHTVRLNNLANGPHRVVIKAGDRIDPRSHSDQVIFHQAIAYRVRS